MVEYLGIGRQEMASEKLVLISENWNLKSGISGILNPESGIHNPKSGIRNSESGIWNPESGVRSPELGTLIPESGIPESGY